MKDNFRIKVELLVNGICIDAVPSGDKYFLDDYVTCNGITLKIGDEYVTAPINNSSKYKLSQLQDAQVILPPKYMSDEKLTRYVNTHLDRVRLVLTNGCANTCSYCPVHKRPYGINQMNEVESALKVALNGSDVRHILISGGSPKLQDLGKVVEMHKYISNKYSQYEVDLMTTPIDIDLQDLKNSGINGLSVNMELWNDKTLKKLCPEKWAIGKKRYLEFIGEGVERFGKDKLRSCLIVGLEPLEDTLRAVDALASVGCNPVLSPYIPFGGVGEKPSVNFLIKAKLESQEICDKHGVKIGPMCKPCSHNTL